MRAFVRASERECVRAGFQIGVPVCGRVRAGMRMFDGRAGTLECKRACAHSCVRACVQLCVRAGAAYVRDGMYARLPLWACVSARVSAFMLERMRAGVWASIHPYCTVRKCRLLARVHAGDAGVRLPACACACKQTCVWARLRECYVRACSLSTRISSNWACVSAACCCLLRLWQAPH